jgi:hypothetical protein
MTQNCTYIMSDKKTIAPKVDIHKYSLISFDFPTWSTKEFPTWIDHPTRDIPSGAHHNMNHQVYVGKYYSMIPPHFNDLMNLDGPSGFDNLYLVVT